MQMLVLTNYHDDVQGGQAMLILDTEDMQTYCMHSFSESEEKVIKS